MKHRSLVGISTFIIGLFLVGCNMPGAVSPSPEDSKALFTQAALTVMAQFTQLPGSGETGVPVQGTVVIGQPTQTGQAAITIFPTSTQGSGGVATAAATDTQVPPTNTLPPPTSTSVPPTNTPVPPTNTAVPPTNTPVPTATPVPIACNAAKFVKDVTYPDGSLVAPGASFLKTWRLRNVGSCTWTAGYVLTFAKGDQMGGLEAPLIKNVAPGEVVDVSVPLIAPLQSGLYRGYWKLRSGSQTFGIGENADTPFWVEVRVAAASTIYYSFADHYCDAIWRSSIGPLICPGRGDEPAGFVVRLNNPNLENRKENELTLWTNPDSVTGGWISGIFPAFSLTAKDTFIADIGCLAGYKKCDVVFQLFYTTNGLNWIKIGEWHEIYDGKITRAQVDLSSLAGQTVQFQLLVNANGDPTQDAAFWLMPQINRAP